jgi:hypothetical protein
MKKRIALPVGQLESVNTPVELVLPRFRQKRNRKSMPDRSAKASEQ